MESPQRLRRGGGSADERPAGRLLAGAPTPPPMSCERQAALFEGATRRVARARRASRQRRAAASVAGLAALLLWAGRHPTDAGRESANATTAAAERGGPQAGALSSTSAGWKRVPLEDIGQFELAPEGSARFRSQPMPQAFYLRHEAGRLRASVDPQILRRPIVVQTPHVRVVVVGTRFDVTVEPDTTFVEVHEGHVRVESSFASVELGPGDRVRSDDARLQPPAPAPRPASTAAPEPVARARALAPCSERSSAEERSRCYQRMAAGQGMAAQNSLYALGLLARDVQRRPVLALEYWTDYERRFPAGTLAPEAALGVFHVLLEMKRLDAALAAGAQFERRFPLDPRTPEVALVRASLLCAAARTREGLELLDRFSDSAPAELRQRLDFARRRCQPGSPGDPPPEATPDAAPGD